MLSLLWSGASALAVLALLAALLIGQPAAIQSDHVLADARATEVTSLRATVRAIPTTAVVSKYCPPRPTC